MGPTSPPTGDRKARDVLSTDRRDFPGVAVRPDAGGGGPWEIEGSGGGMVAAGVGGPITGRGCELLLIDDPIKNPRKPTPEVTRQVHLGLVSIDSLHSPSARSRDRPDPERAGTRTTLPAACWRTRRKTMRTGRPSICRPCPSARAIPSVNRRERPSGQPDTTASPPRNQGTSGSYWFSALLPGQSPAGRGRYLSAIVVEVLPRRGRSVLTGGPGLNSCFSRDLLVDNAVALESYLSHEIPGGRFRSIAAGS